MRLSAASAIVAGELPSDPVTWRLSRPGRSETAHSLLAPVAAADRMHRGQPAWLARLLEPRAPSASRNRSGVPSPPPDPPIRMVSPLSTSSGSAALTRQAPQNDSPAAARTPASPALWLARRCRRSAARADSAIAKAAARSIWRGERDEQGLLEGLPDELHADRQAPVRPAERKRDRRLARDVEGIGEGNVGEVILGNPLRDGEELVDRLRRERNRRGQQAIVGASRRG